MWFTGWYWCIPSTGAVCTGSGVVQENLTLNIPMANLNDVERWWDGGGVTVQLEKQGLGRGFGPKAQNQPTRAQFRAHHWKQRWWAMGGGGGVVWMRWWGGVVKMVVVVVVVVCMRSWACARGDRSRAKKNRKPSHSGLVSVCIRPAGGGGRFCGITGPHDVMVVSGQ